MSIEMNISPRIIDHMLLEEEEEKKESLSYRGAEASLLNEEDYEGESINQISPRLQMGKNMIVK